MTDKEKMIQLTKDAFKTYRIVEESDSSSSNDIRFAFSKYFFYMRMLEGVYPELIREALELEWILEIGE